MMLSDKLQIIQKKIKTYYVLLFTFFCVLLSCIVLFFTLNTYSVQKGSDFNHALLNSGTKEILFCFDKDMIAFSDYDSSAKAWQEILQFSFSPQVEGSIRTISTKKFSFVFDTPQTNNITIFYSTNLLALNGQPVELTINRENSVSNPYILREKSLEITYISRYSNDLSSPVNIFLSKPVSLAEFKKFVVLSNNIRSFPFYLKYDIYTNFVSPNTLCIQTNYQNIQLFPSKLKKDSSYTVSINKQLLDSDETFLYNFSTYPSPEWQGFSSDIYYEESILDISNSQFLIEFENNKSIWLLHNTPFKSTNKKGILNSVPSVSNLDYEIYDQGIRITGDFVGDKEYQITFNPKNLKDVYNQKISQIFSQNIKIIHQKPEIQQIKDVLYVDKNNPVLPYQTINVTNITVTYRLINSAYYTALALYKKEVPVITYYTNIVIDSPLDQIKWNTLDLSDIIDNQTMIVQINLQNKDNPTPNTNFTTILPTSGGMSAHITDTDLLLYAYDLNTLRPHEEMMISIWDPVRNSLQDLGKTKFDGILRVPNHKLPMKALEHSIFIGIYEDPKKFDQIVFLNNNPTAFIGINDRQNFYSSSLLGNYRSYSQTKIDSLIFTDRLNYDIGESVYVHILAREQTNSNLSSKTAFFKNSVEITVLDPNAQVITNFNQKWSEYGSINFMILSNQTKIAGQYTVNIRNKNENFYDTQYFYISTLNPKKMEVDILLKKSNIITQEPLDISLKPQFLSGEILSVDVCYEAYGIPVQFQSIKYPNYYFGQNDIAVPLRWDIPVSKLLFKGKVRSSINSPYITINNKVYSKDNNLQLQLNVEAKSKKQNITLKLTNSIVNVYQPVQLGIHTSKNTVTNNEEVSIKVIAIDPITENIISNIKTIVSIQKNVEINLGKFSFITNIIPINPYFSETILTKVLNSGDNTVHFVPKKSGVYQITVTSRKENAIIQSSKSLFVIGNNEDEQLRLELDKSSYHNGDTAVLHIQNPFPKSQLMLIIQKDQIKDFHSVIVTNDIISYPIAITAQDEPGIQIAATLTSITNDNINKKILFGEAFVKISPRSKELHISATIAKSNYMPQEAVTIDLSVLKNTDFINGEAVVIVRDKAVLNTSESSIPNLIDHFYQERFFNYTTWNSGKQILDSQNITNLKNTDLLPVPIARTMNTPVYNSKISDTVSVRSNFPNTIYFQSGIKLSGTEKTNISFTLPDNISGFDVSIIVYDQEGSFGNTNFSITSSKPLIIDPLIPNFIRPEDAVFWGAYVRNFTASDLLTKVTLDNKYSYLQQDVLIPAYSYALVTNNSIINKDITNSWCVIARSSDYNDGFLKNVPIIYDNPWIFSGTSGVIASSTNIILETPKENTLDRSLTIEMSKNPIIKVKPLINDILNTESLYIINIIRRLLLFIGNEDLLIEHNIISIDKNQLISTLQNDLNSLATYFKDGNSLYITPNRNTTVVNSTMLLDMYYALILAKQNNYHINSELYQKLTVSAQNISKNVNTSKERSLAYIYAVYLLAMNKLVDSDTFQNIYPKLSQNPTVQAIILNTMYLFGYPLSTISKQTLLLLKNTTESGNTINIDSSDSRFIASSLINYYGSYADGIKILQGLDANNPDNLYAYIDFLKKYNTSSEFNADLSVNQDNYILSHKKNVIKIPIDKDRTKIDLQSSDNLFYYFAYSYIPKNINNVYNNGYNIEKIIYSEDDTVLLSNMMCIGNTYTVELKIIPKTTGIQNIEIIIPLYAGIEFKPFNEQKLNSSYIYKNDKLYIYMKIQKETTIKYLIKAQISGIWTAPPISIYNINSPDIFLLYNQDNLIIK